MAVSFCSCNSRAKVEGKEISQYKFQFEEQLNQVYDWIRENERKEEGLFLFESDEIPNGLAPQLKSSYEALKGSISPKEMSNYLLGTKLMALPSNLSTQNKTKVPPCYLSWEAEQAQLNTDYNRNNLFNLLDTDLVEDENYTSTAQMKSEANDKKFELCLSKLEGN